MNIRVLCNNAKAMKGETYYSLTDGFIDDLLNYVEPEQIDVHTVPEQNEEYETKWLSQRINVYPHPTHPLTYRSRYAFKFYLFIYFVVVLSDLSPF